MVKSAPRQDQGMQQQINAAVPQPPSTPDLPF